MGLTGTQGLLVLAAALLALVLGMGLGASLQSTAASQGKRLAEEERPSLPKRRKTSNVILLVLGLFALVFIVAMTVIFCVKGAVPDTLIQYTLGAGGVEALLLAGIKISKVRTGGSPGEKEGDRG